MLQAAFPELLARRRGHVARPVRLAHLDEVPLLPRTRLDSVRPCRRVLAAGNEPQRDRLDPVPVTQCSDDGLLVEV